MSTIIDFSNLSNEVRLIKEWYGFDISSKAFVFYWIQKILGINDNEVLDSITDWSQDRWIDWIYIEEVEDSTKYNVHLFQFKYTENFDKINNHFESNETHKMTTFIIQVFKHWNKDLLNANNLLLDKISDIMSLVNEWNLLKIYIHFCSNLNNWLVETERKNFESALEEEFNMIEFKYHTIKDFISYNNPRPKIKWVLKIIDNNYFSTEDWEIWWIICQCDISDIINLIKNSEWLINEKVFYDNVRVYLWNNKKNSINQKIKETALDDMNNYKFFYFNNWITITCSNFQYNKWVRPLTIEMEEFQIVNWQQTVKTLFEVYNNNSEKLKWKVLLLVRIYQTKWNNSFLVSQKIAEYTNSQNPVKLRDIRANDGIQKKYSACFNTYWYFYENKKDLYAWKDKSKRVDSELLWQILLSFYLKKPWEASNKKSIIFWDEYDNIFKNNYTWEEILFPFLLFKELENKKNIIKKQLIEWENLEYSFIKYATFTILYYISLKFDTNEIKNKYKSENDIVELVNLVMEKYYTQAVESIKLVVEQKKKEQWDSYTHNNFFKNNIFKKDLESKKSNE